MTPTEGISIQRRTLDIEDYVDILRRHRAWILGPAFAGLVVGVVAAFLWPNSYVSTGTIRIQPAMVPQNLVATNVSEEMTQRINATYESIKARQNLTNLIQSHNLYTNERKRGTLEDAVEKMGGDIAMFNLGSSRLSSGRAGSFSFRIQFSYPDKRIAQKICSELVTRFVDDSARQRSQQSLTTTQFLQDAVELAKKELDDIARKIGEFRMQNPGELPEQEAQMLGRLAQMEGSATNIANQISRLNSDKLTLEGQLRALRETAQQTVPVSASAAEGPAAKDGVSARAERLALLDRQIQGGETQLALLREKYRESYPDVQLWQTNLNVLKKQREQLFAELESSRPLVDPSKQRPAPAQVPTREALEARGNITKVQAQISAKDQEVEQYEAQLKELRVKIASSQAKINSSPASQQQYFQLLRDEELAKVRYNEYSTKWQRSSLATDLENRKQGELLDIIEPPVIPTSPYAPNRGLIVGMGLAIGIGLGVALAAGRELKDTSLKNLKDVRAYTKLNVLGSIPLLENDFVVRRRRRLMWLAWSASFMLGMLLMSGSVLYYFTTTV